MSLEKKLSEKLRPHADRIVAGNNNEYDYLPAVLLHVVEGQTHQLEAAKESSEALHEFIKSTHESTDVHLSSIDQRSSESWKSSEETLQKISSVVLDLHAKSNSYWEASSSTLQKNFNEQTATLDDLSTSGKNLHGQIHKGLETIGTSTSTKHKELIAVLSEMREVADAGHAKLFKLIIATLATSVIALAIGIYLLVRH
jgi:hypothetical protein